MNRRNALGVMGGVGLLAAGSLSGGSDLMRSVVGKTEWKVRTTWDIPELTGKNGRSLLQALVDVDGDGELELVANAGAQAHFVCYDQNQQLLWENIQDTTQHKGCYFPKIADGALFYGDRSSNTLYCLNRPPL